MTESQAAARRYLLHVLSTLDLSAARLAAMAKLAPTTLTRFLNGTEHKFNLSTTTLDKIKAATQISYAPFLDADDFASSILEREVYLEDPRVYRKPALFEVPLIGEAQPGVWREESLFLDSFEKRDGWKGVNFASLFWDLKEQFAVQVRGRSVERFAADGDYLLCVRLSTYIGVYGWLNNGLVILEKRSDDGRTIEISPRYLRHREHHSTLHFASTDQKFSEIIQLDSPLAAEPPTRIIGVVDCVVRRPMQGLTLSDIDVG